MVTDRNEIYVSGFYRTSPIIFDTTTLTCNGNPSIFILKFSSDGIMQYAKGINGGTSGFGDQPTSINWYGGNCFITGYTYSDSLYFGSILKTKQSGLYLSDIFVAKFNDSLLSTPELSFQNSVKLFPNPTSEKIELAELSIDKTSIDIFSETGQKVISEQTEGMSSVFISVKGLPQGMYIVRVTNEHNTVTRKFYIYR